METLKSGRYTIPEQWNTASMGQWVLGTDTQTGERVFIKEFRSYRYDDNPQGFENIRRLNERTENYRLRTEQVNAAVGKIAGASGDVVVTTDFFRENNKLYKVNKFVEFMSWKPEEVHSHLSVQQVDTLMLRLANAIAALHQAKLLHCDLKPENVFIVERDGSYIGMVSDFDDSFFMDKIPHRTDVVGTPEYMSPELASYVLGEEDEPQDGLPLGPASDLFALGLIYHMYLTGKTPSFDKKYNGQLFSALFDGADYTLSSDLDAAHYTLIQRLLVPLPALRIDSCTALAAEIKNIIYYRSKEYRLTLTENGKPLANRSVPLFCTYPIGKGTQQEENTEPVQTIRTDGKGTAKLLGLLPDMRLFIECDDQLKPIVWRDNGGVKECTLSLTPPAQYTIQVLCDGRPCAGRKIVLCRKAGGKTLSLDPKTTNAEGKAVYPALPEGQYSMKCDGILVPIRWDDANRFVYSLKTYCVRVTRENEPVAGEEVRLSVHMGTGKQEISAGKTDAGGEYRFTFAQNNKKWSVSCKGKEEDFLWPASGRHEVQLPPGVRLVMSAKLEGANTPVDGVTIVVAVKENGKSKILSKQKTDVKGQADLGSFEPGEYYLAVTEAPKGYVLQNAELKRAYKAVIASGRRQVSKTFTFKREVVLEQPENVVSDEQIPESVSADWRRLVRYKNGSIILVNKNGNTKKLPNERPLGLYGLERYKKS